MSCYRPIPAFRTPHGVVFSELRRHDILGDIEIPCGQCVGCRLRRAREWTVRCVHEASLWEDNCFVTLTYEEENLPPENSLDHRDFQLFMKRMRRGSSGPIRFFMCGEYGPLNLRPHYHALLFNRNFYDRKAGGKSGSGSVFYNSDELSEYWKLGMATVQDLNPQTVAYCTRYVVDKVTGPGADEHYQGRKPEYCACSLKPGIGAAWYAKYGLQVSTQDFVVLDGKQMRPPKYYDKLARKLEEVPLDEIEFEREQRAKAAAADNTDDRRKVREVVHKAKIRHLKRSL